MLVSIYQNALDKKGVSHSYLELLDFIKNGRWQKTIEYLRSLSKSEYDEAKKNIPAITFAGVFSERNDAFCTQYNNMMVLDIDKLDDIKKAKESILSCVYTHALFVSPSGNGLKVLVKLSSGKEDHDLAFEQLQLLFQKNFDIDVDRSGKNVSRLCFISYDPELYLDHNSEVFNVSTTRKAVVATRTVKRLPDEKVQAKVDVALKWNEKYFKYVTGNRNNYIYALACILNEVGVIEGDTLHFCKMNYDLQDKEIESSIRSAYRRNSIRFNTKPLEKVSESSPEEVMSPKIQTDRKNDKPALKIVSMKEMMKSIFEKYDPNSTVSSCIPDVDFVLGGGLHMGNVYGMIGREMTFKSILAQHIAIENAKKGVPVIYVNGEMSGIQFMERTVKKEMEISLNKLMRSGEVNMNNYQEVMARMDTSLDENLFMSNDIGFSYQSIIKAVEEMKKNRGKAARLLIVDGISSMEDCRDGEVFSAIQNSLYLKEVAKECNVALIVLCHIKTGIDKHLRDCGLFVRGGVKVLGNMDGYFSNSLLIDPQTNELLTDDIEYLKNMFYMRFCDKRGSGSTVSKIIHVKQPLSLDITNFNPEQYEVRLKRK